MDRGPSISIVLQLLQVTLKITLRFQHGIPAEFFESTFRQGESNHSFGSNASGGDDAYVGALVRSFYRLTRGKINRLQWTPQCRDGLQVATYPDLLAIGDAAFNPASVIVRTAELCIF